MVTKFSDFQLLREFNSSFEPGHADYLPYGMSEAIVTLKKTIKEERKVNRRPFKEVLSDLLTDIIALPYSVKHDLVKYAFITFAGSIALSDVSNAFAAAEETAAVKKLKNEYSRLESDAVNMIDELNLNPVKNLDLYAFKRPMNYSDTLVDFLKHEEGLNGKAVLKAYDIGDGMITIGYGHAERKSKTSMKAGVTTITEDQATDLLLDDIKEAQRGVDRIVREMNEEGCDVFVNQNMYDAMVSMTYNMGIGNMRKSSFLQILKSGDVAGAARQILKQNIPYKGLILRRKRESFLFSQKDPVKIDQLLAIK